jgi:murein DD-endopeptidase MepM/ murein hydrolase activator NlpD
MHPLTPLTLSLSKGERQALPLCERSPLAYAALRVDRLRVSGQGIGLALALALAACTPPPPPKPAPVPRPAPVVQQAPKPAPKPAAPTWTARKVIADAVEVAASTVTVAPGDTLARIAQRTGTGIGALAAENDLSPPYRLEIGDRIRIPAGRYHRVKPGETGIAIARAYGVKWDGVIAANRLTAPYTLGAGQMLRLPTKAAVAAMTLEQRAAAFRLDIDDVITGSEPAAAPPRAPVPRAVPKPLPEPAAFTGRFAWPLDGPIVSGFGPKPGGRYNDGINIRAAAGTPVKAAADGVVAYAGDGLEGFGGLILVKHGDGWVTAYAHNEELLVGRGQSIKRGQTIARVGSTGSVDSPQLHFEIRRGRTPVNPTTQLPPRG